MSVKEAEEIKKNYPDIPEQDDICEYMTACGFLHCWNQMQPVIESHEKLLRCMQRVNGGDDICVNNPAECINHVSIRKGLDALALIEKIEGGGE